MMMIERHDWRRGTAGIGIEATGVRREWNFHHANPADTRIEFKPRTNGSESLAVGTGSVMVNRVVLVSETTSVS